MKDVGQCVCSGNRLRRGSRPLLSPLPSRRMHARTHLAPSGTRIAWEGQPAKSRHAAANTSKVFVAHSKRPNRITMPTVPRLNTRARPTQQKTPLRGGQGLVEPDLASLKPARTACLPRSQASHSHSHSHSHTRGAHRRRASPWGRRRSTAKAKPQGPAPPHLGWDRSTCRLR